MLRNYFKVMIRGLVKRKAFTLINLIGLAAGMAICLLLALYIQNELGYDLYQERGDHIYRLDLERKYPNRSTFFSTIPLSFGQAVRKEFPEVLESTRVFVFDDGQNGGAMMAVGEKVFTEKKAVLMVDSNFFKVFTGHFLQGDGNSALQHPGTAILTESSAKRYFGSVANAMGKEVIVDDFSHCLITGVCKDWPEKSHFQFSVLISRSGTDSAIRPDYVYFTSRTYLLLNKNASASALEAKLPLIVDKYVAATIPENFGESYSQFVAEGNGYHYSLQPLRKIHLFSQVEDDFRPVVTIRIILWLGAIGAFILFLACVNFINLSTALSIERAREVGIRKTFGSRKGELVGQFLSDSVLFSIVSMLLALMLASLFTPLLNKVSGNELSFSYFLHPVRLLVVFGFSVLVGLAAGLYPSLVLSSFEPMLVLKGRFKSNPRGIALRNGLVVFQFAISVILIICTIVVNKQLQFVLGDQLGFKRDHIINVEGTRQLVNRNKKGEVTDNRQAFVDEVSKIAGVKDITECGQLPGSNESGGGNTWVALDNNVSRTEKYIPVDDKYTNLLGLQLKEGRSFSREFTTDSFSIMLNESAVEDFGLKKPIGARFICKEPWMNPADGKSQFIYTVIGVVKNYHFQSLHKKIAPLIFTNSNLTGWGSAGIRIKGDHFKSVVAQIGDTWKRFDPKHDFRFTFLDQTVADQYKAEETEQKIFTIFSLLAILIACVGLFGLVAYSTIQRSKEISIRKVLGATSGDIILILSRDFLGLVMIASLIAFPLAWWGMHKWLQGFSYRVNITWWVFGQAGTAAVLIAFATISFQAIKAATANPVKNLKAE
jgi:putative ABC transport system permease protein